MEVLDYVDDDVFSIENVKDDNVYYLNCRDDVCCLCVNGEVIEQNVYIGSLKLKDDYAYYLEDGNYDLFCYDGKNAKIIADDAGGSKCLQVESCNQCAGAPMSDNGSKLTNSYCF